MTPSFEEENVPSAETPVWLKRTLLTFLFTSAAAGFIFGALSIRQSVSVFPSRFSTDPALEEKLSELQTLFQKSAADPSSEEILCQGILRTATRGDRVVLNGEAIEAGAGVSGVKVLEITASNVLVECNGETFRLEPGERFIPKKR